MSRPPHRQFSDLPRFHPAAQSSRRYGLAMRWKAVTDLGHAAGADFDLGRRATCDAWLMDVFYAVSSTITVIGEAEAQRFLALDGTPELRKALKAWFDRGRCHLSRSPKRRGCPWRCAWGREWP